MTFPILASLLVRLVVLLPFQLLRLSLATPSRWTSLTLSVLRHCVVALLLTLRYIFLLFMCLIVTFMVNIVLIFQAEDGIRDYKVTGVQTCALPISERYRSFLARNFAAHVAYGRLWLALGKNDSALQELRTAVKLAPGSPHAHLALSRALYKEIGRASCRERV